MAKTIRVYGFPCNITAELVKEFMERYTGEGAVYAVEVEQVKHGSQRTGARVQFTTTDDAAIIKLLAYEDETLWFSTTSYLKARNFDRDIVPKPKVFQHSMENLTLHFGCQISKEMFSVLWTRENVTVKFGPGLKRFYFFLSHRSAQYKLELPYESVWQIELQRPLNRCTKFLLIQLFGAPRIYERDISVLTYFKESIDDQWVREVDFSPSRCIGQSSALCLELPYGVQLPKFDKNFYFYKENNGRFILDGGSTFSPDSYLVPTVSPPQGVRLPYKILFQINSLVQHGCLPGPALDANFYHMVDPRRRNIAYIEHALEMMRRLPECCYQPVRWLNEQYQKYNVSGRPPRPPALALDDGLVYVHRVQITPTKVYFCGPEVNMSNRVLRNYPNDIDNFIRVSFVDEDLDQIRSVDLSLRSSSATEERRTGIYRRILSILRNGIVVADKKFEFLAFSSSQLKDNSLWMFASRPELTAADIRAWMGDFRAIRNVAKYAARLGQSFGSSRETLNVGRHEIETIPDIEVVRDGTRYVFSDGIGKISAELAETVAKKCGLKKYIPSAFQIRYGGYKGVVAVDPTSSVKLSLRKSMCKYESENTSLDVLAWSRYLPYFLNRQLITLLSTLGVRDLVFERKQRDAIARLDTILTDPLRAQEALEMMFSGESTNILKEMLMCGYKPDAEPFLSMMLQTFRASKLLDLRTKTRIFVPDGRNMMGCLDETRTLAYGEAFVQYSGTRSTQLYNASSSTFSNDDSDEYTYIIEGTVVVAKNPCLHPGDVRVLKAVDVPSLHHMVDCIVFPQTGKRPHPSECSGSDLDGDLYFVSWDQDLIPPCQIRPMDYTPAPHKLLDHDVKIEEVEEYFADYMVNDSLGIISNAHIVFADKEPDKAMSKPCIELAGLSSIAVDFAKTGVPAETPRELRVKEYPDFMEKADNVTYESQRVIGKLFREVRDKAPEENPAQKFTREMARRSYDPDMEVDGFEDYINDAFCYKSEYDSKLGSLMKYYGIKTEAEIISGCILKMSKSFNKKRDSEAISLAVRSLRKEARSWFNEKSNDFGPGDDDVYAKASAWYHVTYHPTFYNEGMKQDHFLSFPWCVYDKLINIKKSKANTKRSSHSSSLEYRLSRRLQLS